MRRFFLRLYHLSEWESAAHDTVATNFAVDSGAREEVRERLLDVAADAQTLKMK